MKSEMDKLMEKIEVDQPCPTNCGGTIKEVDYSQVGQGVFLQCDKNGITHYRRISPPNRRGIIHFKKFRQKTK